MEYEARYKQLNAAQKQAVDTIDGPLMVVAGPGTGKTELLSMRAANILKKTDTLPENILCLTFTESGADAMRKRLTEIIGPDAYKVAIHTFHGFGVEIMNRHGEYFYNGARFRPATDLMIYETMHGIFDELSYDNPLAPVMNGEYTYLRDTISAISDLKRSGLTSDELLQVLTDNERVLDNCERDLQESFADRINKTTKDKLQTVAAKVDKLPREPLPPGIVPLADTLALSLSHAISDAENSDSTKPVTAWKNAWLEKNDRGELVFKDRRRIARLRAVAFVYYQYLKTMEENELYDFDDMVLSVVHALEVIDELKFNLQEQYLYIMVDEFQDTNLAQARILRSLTDNPANEGKPNLMVVGDDDQAIYSFQGAEISNILQFNDLYPATQSVTLTDNYRSSETILKAARTVITQGSARLENYVPGLDKTLTAHNKPVSSAVSLHEHATTTAERMWLVREVRRLIDDGVTPSEITVIARRHHELVELLPYFAHEEIPVNYERRENVLENDIIVQLELLARIIQCLANGELDEADARLPELLAHPAWGIEPSGLWKLSLAASRDKKSWLEHMNEDETFAPLHGWLIRQAKSSLTLPLEEQLDELIGYQPDPTSSDTYVSPLYGYFFADDGDYERYLGFLDALRTIRDTLRDHTASRALKLTDFLEFIDAQRRLGTNLVSVRNRSRDASTHVNLMTAHKSKGLEFDHVFICGGVDSSWGERIRSKSRLISYPENLPIAPAGDSYDERLRLFFVAMTRAKKTLTLSYSTFSDNLSQLARASFLSGESWQASVHDGRDDQKVLVEEALLAWHQPLAEVPRGTKQELLTPLIENYRLSETHLTTFLDVSRGGPQYFLLHCLLKFPSATNPNAAYGSAIHRTLQQTHAHFAATKKQRPVEDILKDFETNLQAMNLAKKDFETYSRRGGDYLQVFLTEKYADFNANQKPEVSFASQNSLLGDARLTGSLDLIEVDEQAKTLRITDYKTGKASNSWKGKTDGEKIKLHKYRQQLMFYKLLAERSRDYSKYQVENLAIQFVEPTASGSIIDLDLDISSEELEEFSQLIAAAWQHITQLSFPDTSGYSPDYKGILAFEQDLLAGKL